MLFNHHRAEHRRQLAIGAGAALLALVAAGCGSSTNSDTTGGAASTTPAPSGAPLSVADTSLGRVVVDASGFTVYMLTADSPGQSSCSSDCLSSWPPVAAPSSGTQSPPDITAKVDETETTTGTAMLTVGGWPAYTYVQDTAPGDVSGEGITSFGGTWYAIGPNGQPVTGATGSSSPSPSPSGGSGSGNSY
jgi:predicted lipoprotein with Yx(FWY)xxD motif